MSKPELPPFSRFPAGIKTLRALPGIASVDAGDSVLARLDLDRMACAGHDMRFAGTGNITFALSDDRRVICSFVGNQSGNVACPGAGLGERTKALMSRIDLRQFDASGGSHTPYSVCGAYRIPDTCALQSEALEVGKAPSKVLICFERTQAFAAERVYLFCMQLLSFCVALFYGIAAALEAKKVGTSLHGSSSETTICTKTSQRFHSCWNT